MRMRLGTPAVNNALDLNDLSSADGAESQTDISGVAGRFGVKASSDIGNGMTAHGRYEFATTTDKEEEGVEDTRIATVGLSGAFGRVDVGNQWSAYFDTFGTLVSPTYLLGYYLYSSVGGGPYRTSNTIKYSNSFGQLYAELDFRLNEESSPEGSDVAEKLRGDGWGLGLSWSVNDNLTIAAAFDSESREGAGTNRPAIVLVADTTASDGVLIDKDASESASTADNFGHDEDRIGIAVKGTFGGYWASVGWQNIEYDDVKDTPLTGEIDADDDGTPETVSATVEVHDNIDTFFVYGGGNISEKTNWLVGYSQANDGIKVQGAGAAAGTVVALDDSQQLTWGVYHNLGGGLRLYYEGTNLDSENKSWDGNRHLFGMRIDF